ncbi:MAG: ABC transporter ATP-binding protein [Eubacteriales bacterium]|nr:ABC transporter ATP-binding protein [Eubacteriales bacterium]
MSENQIIDPALTTRIRYSRSAIELLDLIFSLGLAFLIGQFTERALEGAEQRWLLLRAGLIVAIVILRFAIMRALRTRLLLGSRELKEDLHLAYARRYITGNTLNDLYFSDPNQSLRVLNEDFEVYCDYRLIELPVLRISVIAIFGYALALGYNSPKLLGIFTAAALLQVIPPLLFRFYFEAIYLRMRDVEDELTGWLIAAYQGFENLKLYNAIGWYFSSKSRMERDYIKYGNQAEMTVLLERAISEFIASLLKIGSYAIVGYFLATGEIDSAVAVASLVIAGPFFHAFKECFAMINARARSKAAANRLLKLLPLQQAEEVDFTISENSDCQLAISDLMYTYPEERSRLGSIQVPELYLNTGEKILITGANGSGKSTLMRLITGILKPSEGTVLINQVATDKLSDEARSQAFAYLMQADLAGESTVGTLIEEAAGAEEFAARSILDKLGFKKENLSKPLRQLSGGELKQLYLALTLVRDAAILILDEPSLHLDQNATEALIKLLKADSRAQILITHDPQLQSLSQRHYRIRTGTVNVLEEVSNA